MFPGLKNKTTKERELLLPLSNIPRSVKILETQEVSDELLLSWVGGWGKSYRVSDFNYTLLCGSPPSHPSLPGTPSHPRLHNIQGLASEKDPNENQSFAQVPVPTSKLS